MNNHFTVNNHTVTKQEHCSKVTKLTPAPTRFISHFITPSIAMMVMVCVFIILSTSTPAYSAENIQKNTNEHKHAKTEDTHNKHEHEEDEHNPKKHSKNEHDEGEENAAIQLSQAQLTLAEIKVSPLSLQVMSYNIYAPGEIKANDYTSYLVSPRVNSVVLKRHVALGDHVTQGQALVTLFSESVAEAQASYRVASAEWQRVQKIGRKAVGDKRFVEAQTNFEANLGRLFAFGLSNKAIQSLTQYSMSSLKMLSSTPSTTPSTNNLGQYTLNAITSGAVLSDDFRQGQRVESGDTLIELADEHTLWVEARLAPTMQQEIPVGSVAQVVVGDNRYTAKVTQKAHTIDPITRTRIVRLQVENDDHKLHPGLFADIYFTFATKQQVLAVPEEALIRGSDGDWMVFVKENDKYQGVEIELGRAFSRIGSSQKMREISGIVPNTKVVVKGAFYVAAEIAKSGFDAHNH